MTFGKRTKSGKKDNRMTFLITIIFLFNLAIIIRLFVLQIKNHNFYVALASNQYDIYEKLLPERGKIYLEESNGELYPLATNKDYFLVSSEPRLINDKDKEKIVSQLASLLEIELEELDKKINQNELAYQVLKHQVGKETVEKIKELNFKGIYYRKEVFRFYPEKNIASHLLGFVGYENDRQVGQYGLEGYFNEELAGTYGEIKSQRDALGYLIFVDDYQIKEAVPGEDLVLTLDHAIQFKACEKLAETVKKHGADGGSVIVMKPQSGAILAMCSVPDFDLNQYNQVEDLSVFNNPVTFFQYEPGSVFKVITMAAGLDSGKITPNTTYEDTGEVKIAGFTIKNSDLKAHGRQTTTNILENSLNTGAIFVMRQAGQEVFKKYVKNFGFGSPTGLEVEAENSGNIRSLEQKGEIFAATASFGQGISVTPLQLVTAVNAIANQGKLMRPYLVKEIQKSDGTVVKTQPKVVRQVVSSRTANLLTGMMVSVVRNGHGKRAGVAGYYIAGKTGTAQVPKKEGKGYEENKNIGSFAGFAPVDNPRFTMLVKIDNPKDVIWAESSAAPLFGELAKFMLNYYEIPPSVTE
ncbi:MAG: penicillin-binding protein 2 [bacterium]